MTKSMFVGPFELQKPIGEGGMGQVWRARHVRQNIPVAVKIVTGEAARKPEFLEAFRNEVRAMAGLNHPGIIMVLDQGVVSAEAAANSDGQLQADSPWLAMEFASLGALDRFKDPLSWPELRLFILELLDALGHAHARGVVHRDLKPGNLLMAADSDLRPGVKLTDFGLAHAMDQASGGDNGMTVGTPQYMAPEQFQGAWRDFGPWTDLYALGVMIYQMASGRHPFGDVDNVMALIHAHMTMVPPPLESIQTVPDGFEEWIQRMMAKNPRHRFQCAADAAWALTRLDASAQDTATLMPERRLGQQDIRLDEDGDGPDTQVNLEMPSGLNDAVRLAMAQGGSRSDDPMAVNPGTFTPPVSRFWRRADPGSLPVNFQDAGLGLYGLRAIPMVGRDAEREAIWSALMEVAGQGRAQVMVLHGPIGVGKSRLVEWMLERAHELGAAQPWTAAHTPDAEGAEGLRDMLSRRLGCLGLDNKGTRERLERILKDYGSQDPEAADVLSGWLQPDLESTLQESPDAHQGPLAQMVALLGQERAVMMWLDNAQWDRQAVAMARFLLEQREALPVPVLMLLTVSDEALVEHPEANADIEALLALDGAKALQVSPLPDAEYAQLVRELLNLQEGLAAALTQRTRGNPLFAVKLINDWIERDALKLGKGGFGLPPGDTAPLPKAIDQVWSERLERFAQGPLAQQIRYALELAAVLGAKVHLQEWRTACQLGSFAPDDDLLERLQQARLVVVEPEHWAFANSMLRETLLSSAAKGGRTAGHHRFVANALHKVHGQSPGVARRIGIHLAQGQSWEQALAYLLSAAQEHRVRGQDDVALSTLNWAERVLTQARAPENEPRWGQTWFLRAWVLGNMRRLEEAQKWMDRAETAARRFGWSILPLVLRRTARLATLRGEYRQDALKEATKIFGQAKDMRGMATCLYDQALIERQRGKTAQCEKQCRHAMKFFDRAGDTVGVADCENLLGEVARLRSDADAAEAHYQRSMALYKEKGYGEWVVPQVNLGMLWLEVGRYEQAREVLVQSMAHCKAVGRHGLLIYIHAALMPCVIHGGDGNACKQHQREVERLIAQTGVIDLDIARPAQLAARLAFEAGRRALARDLYGLAMTQWQMLGHLNHVQEIKALLSK